MQLDLPGFEKHVRMHADVPMGHRVALYPDGVARIQGAYVWQEGGLYGVTWMDLPVVRVDAQGREVSSG